MQKPSAFSALPHSLSAATSLSAVAALALTFLSFGCSDGAGSNNSAGAGASDSGRDLDNGSGGNADGSGGVAGGSGGADGTGGTRGRDETCESPASCELEQAECGQVHDYCGGMLDCGSCESGFVCSANRCVPEDSAPASGTQYLPPSGPWWGGEGMDGDSEVMMVDVMVPPQGNYVSTYWSTINFQLGPRGGYCGIQNNKKLDGSGRPLNNIFSLWDLQDGAGECNYSYASEDTVVDGFGGEGTGIHTHNDFGWIPGQWYTTLLRRWYTGDTTTHVGFWMYDYTKNEWSQYVTLVTPETDAKLKTGVGGFVENFWKEYGLNERIGYFRRPWKLNEDGTWIKPKTLSATANWSTKEGWDAEPYGTDGLILKACGANVATASSYEYPYSTGYEKSPLAHRNGEIEEVWMVYNQTTDQLEVHWAYDPGRPPQLSYELTVTATAGGESFSFSTSEQEAGARMHVIDLPSSIDKYAGFEAEVHAVDIFDQQVVPGSGSYVVGEGAVDTRHTLTGSDLTIVSSSSSADPAANAIDENAGTFWQSTWSPSAVPMPHSIVFKLPAGTNVTGVRLLNRQDNTNGYLKGLTLQAGNDGSSWTYSQSATMPNSKDWSTLSFDADGVSYLKLTIESNQAGTNLASLAEIEVLAD